MPDLLQGEEFYVKSFFRLSSERHNTPNAIGNIPWMTSVAYAERAGFDGDMAELFADIIGVVDSRYVSHHEKRLSAQQKAQADAARGSGGKLGSGG